MPQLIVSKIGTLVWHIQAPSIAPAIKRRALAEEFEPKNEYHITLIGYATSTSLKDADALRQAVVALTPPDKACDYKLDDKLYLIDRPKDLNGVSVPRQSLVALAKSQWVSGFIDQLGERLGQPLPQPFPHITLYTKGDAALPWRGIGIDSQVDFDKYCSGLYANNWKGEAA
jgi:hypothetical protein